MQGELASESLQCPYCWERIEVLVDPSVPEQSYVEDCQVCCRPILIHVRCEPDGCFALDARAENE